MEAPQVQYVTTSDGHNIAYAVCGKGIPLVRVPSLFGNFTLQWDRGILDHHFRTLSDHFELVLFDCRGQGASTRGLADGTTLDDYVRDLELLVDKLGLDRFILLGMSAMGKIAVRYALKHPDRSLALLLHGYSDPYRGTRLGLDNLMRTDWPLYLQTCARMGWTWTDSTNVVGVLRACTTQEDHIRQFLALEADPGDPLLQAIEAPALVMATREDSRPLGAEAEARRLAALIPGGRLVVFDDASGGFDSTNGGPPPIIGAIQALLQERANRDPQAGRSPASPAVLSAREIEVLLSSPAVTPSAKPPHSDAGLSPRESEVLSLIAAGRSNQQIAAELVISLRTVERHITNLYSKIGARGKADATAYALRHGYD
jgi:pimeloyl-ACP methyl ester carboxylesterase